MEDYFGGVLRSATITIVFVMSTQGLNLEQAYNFVKARKLNILPNFWYKAQVIGHRSKVIVLGVSVLVKQ